MNAWFSFKSTLFHTMHQAFTALVFLLFAVVPTLPANAFQSKDTPVHLPGSEWDMTDPSDWDMVHNMTANQLTNFLTQNNQRIVDLEVIPGETILYSAVTVKNEGAYAKASWWYPSLSAVEIHVLLAANQARLIDIEAYKVEHGGETPTIMYAVVMVPNTGSDQKDWIWYFDITTDGLNDIISQGNYRLIDLDAFVPVSDRHFAAILIRNTGADQRDWGWLVNVTWAEIEPYLPGGRLLDIVYEGEERFTVVIENCPCPGWWVYMASSPAYLAQRALQTGARIIDLEIYTIETGLTPTTYYAGVMVENLNPESRRVANILASVESAWEYGLLLKKVGGPQFAALQANYVHEPLSSIKVLPHFYAMKQVQAGVLTLDTTIPNYVESGQPDEYCYLPDINPATKNKPLRDVLEDMMVPSSNPDWAATVNYFGKDTIEDYLHQELGMTQTEIRRVGCSSIYNRWTLNDAAKLYESVANGSELHGAARIDFYEIMAGKWSDINQVIDEEAPPGMSQDDRNLFKSLVQIPRKDGGWQMSSSGEIQEQSSRTRVGVLRVPECNGPFRVTGSYVYGIFITAPSAMNSTVESVSLEAATELLRQPIRDALSQWTLCAPINLGVITSAGGLVQSDGNRLVVTLPPGAVSSQVNIYFTNQVDPNLLLPANMADLGRFGLDALDENGSPFHTFNTPITIDAGYQDEDLANSGGDESRVSLAGYDERLEQWVLLPSTVNPATNRVSAQVQHFSVFAVLVNQGTYKVYAPAVSR